MATNPQRIERNPLALRVDGKQSSRKGPRLDIMCPQCNCRNLVWSSLPAADQEHLLFPCEYCHANIVVHFAIHTFPDSSTPDHFKRIKHGSGRAIKYYKLTTSREDRPRMTNHGTEAP